ncbi:hypothetical protein D9M68_823450 [compost metagenome]
MHTKMSRASGPSFSSGAATAIRPASPTKSTQPSRNECRASRSFSIVRLAALASSIAGVFVTRKACTNCEGASARRKASLNAPT